MWFSVFLVLVSDSVLYSPSICQDDFYLGLCSWVATFWERAAYSYVVFVFICIFVILAVFHLGFKIFT